MAKRTAKIGAQSLLNRLAGVSIMGFGASWRAREPDHEIIRKLLIALADHRALFVSSIYEQPQHVLTSVERMRAEITAAMQACSADKSTQAALKMMRAACHEFTTEATEHDMLRGEWEKEQFLLRLGKMRGAFGLQIAALANAYGIDIDKNFTSILPAQT